MKNLTRALVGIGLVSSIGSLGSPSFGQTVDRMPDVKILNPENFKGANNHWGIGLSRTNSATGNPIFIEYEWMLPQYKSPNIIVTFPLERLFFAICDQESKNRISSVYGVEALIQKLKNEEVRPLWYYNGNTHDLRIDLNRDSIVDITESSVKNGFEAFEIGLKYALGACSVN